MRRFHTVVPTGIFVTVAVLILTLGFVGSAAAQSVFADAKPATGSLRIIGCAKPGGMTSVRWNSYAPTRLDGIGTLSTAVLRGDIQAAMANDVVEIWKMFGVCAPLLLLDEGSGRHEISEIRILTASNFPDFIRCTRTIRQRQDLDPFRISNIVKYCMKIVALRLSLVGCSVHKGEPTDFAVCPVHGETHVSPIVPNLSLTTAFFCSRLCCISASPTTTHQQNTTASTEVLRFSILKPFRGFCCMS